jgi:hypothetical protein
MRSLVRSIGIALGVLTLASVQNASAQITSTVEFTTSFPFTVGNTTVPAGNYTIRPDDDNPQILELTGKNASVLFQTDVATERETPAKTELVFSRYGGSNYVLKNIWVEGSNSGVETTPAEGERHAAKGGAKSEQRVAGRRKSATKSGTTSGQ